jgi:acyl-homoserine-lactone acylase
MYKSHYGPIVSVSQLGGWSTSTAYTFRNANHDNFSIVEQWRRMNVAKSLDDLKQVNGEVQGIPWVNTIAVDRAGTALYMDASRTPNLSPAALQRYRQALATDTVTQAVDAAGVTLLDGSDSAFEWQDTGALAPGIVPFAQSPVQERNDFLFNANDSYWMTNPKEPLTGYSPLFGLEATPRSPRTLMNAFYLTEAKADGASGADGKFSFDELLQVEFSDRESLAELLADQVVTRCSGAGPVASSGQMVDISGACAVLESWDHRFTLDSVGAVLWREFLAASC